MNFGLPKIRGFVPASKIWRILKFVRCADAMHNWMKLQVSSNQAESLNPANKYLKSILPVQFENCVLS
jgi:hypothetical protein